MRKKKVLRVLLVIGLVFVLSGLIVTSTGCPPAQPMSTALPTVTVDCNYAGEIYKNNTDDSINVTVQATDKCESDNSMLCIFDAEGYRINIYEIPDGKTGAATFPVPAGGGIAFGCSGDEGIGSYSIGVLGCGPAQSVGTTFPTVTVDCYYAGEIYKNNTDDSINVAVQATDKCETQNSTLKVYDAERENIIKEYEIKDGKTGATTFSVPVGGSIAFGCKGDEGSCSYTTSH